MKYCNLILVCLVILLGSGVVKGQKTDASARDSANIALLEVYKLQIEEAEQQRVADSIEKANLEINLKSLKSADLLQKEQIIRQLKILENNERIRISKTRSGIDSLQNSASKFPVISVSGDTLFFIYSKFGASTPEERAATITRKIKKLVDDDFLFIDSILVIQAENEYDIVYSDLIIMSISETDAAWYNKSSAALAHEFKDKIKNSVLESKKENSILKLLLRISLVLFVIALAWLIIWSIGKGNRKLLFYVNGNKDIWLKDLSYKDYTFLSVEQELQGIHFLITVFRWFFYALLLYITLPIIFSIFPFSRNWADMLFLLIWNPFKGIIISIWKYLPNLFNILVIYFVMKYFIRFVKYTFSEIEAEKLKISGFHADWAMPTFSIVKVLLYAFMFVLIFPYLPGSDSTIFQGVSVFIGILFSLGSSSAIANMVAGLVITYMRPFKIGDRIKIGDVTGDIVEKDLLVTRVITIKNEVITIPNSAVLSGNTINYTIEAKEKGLIIHTTVTIGYDVPWKDMHEALIEAALRTEMLLKNPEPFVLQTSLEDFYVAYQINAYTKEASKQAVIYSGLHQNIQDVCNERGIEILSPHYRAARDGNRTTIPSEYLSDDYRAPGFTIKMEPDNKKQD